MAGSSVVGLTSARSDLIAPSFKTPMQKIVDIGTSLSWYSGSPCLSSDTSTTEVSRCRSESAADRCRHTTTTFAPAATPTNRRFATVFTSRVVAAPRRIRIWRGSTTYPSGRRLIYLVKCGDFHKIGFTSGRTAEARINSMRTGNPYPITLVKTWDGPPALEGVLHAAFAHCRISGEWFALTEEDLAAVDRLATHWVTVGVPVPERPAPKPEPEPPPKRELRFPPGLNVEVEGAACGGCGSWVRFVGALDHVVCDSTSCRGYKLSMDLYMGRRDRRDAMVAVMRKYAL